MNISKSRICVAQTGERSCHQASSAAQFCTLHSCEVAFCTLACAKPPAGCATCCLVKQLLVTVHELVEQMFSCGAVCDADAASTNCNHFALCSCTNLTVITDLHPLNDTDIMYYFQNRTNIEETILPIPNAHSARIRWTDDDDKLLGSYPYRKYMVCLVLNIIQWTLC